MLFVVLVKNHGALGKPHFQCAGVFDTWKKADDHARQTLGKRYDETKHLEVHVAEVSASKRYELSPPNDPVIIRNSHLEP